MGKKVKKFKLFKVPRYLPGQVKKAVLVNDLHEYNKHRYNVFTIKARVDHHPLPMNPHNYVNSQRLVNDVFRIKEIDKHNKEMIKKINTINRMGGRVDTFNPIAYANKSKWRSHHLKMKEIERHNKDIYQKIFNAKSSYTVEAMDKFWKYVLEKLQITCKFPIAFLANKSIDQIVREQPSISGDGFVCACAPPTQQKIERPKCFMDFRVKEGVYLGRIIIELYYDYVPVTVQNFLSICCNEDGLSFKNCLVHRVAPGLYLETGDITKGNGKGGTSIYGDTFAEENHKLEHTRTGVLSTVPVGRKLNNSQFSITLTSMEKWDGVRVVFGKVIRGNQTLYKINDLGRKFGKPVVDILICNCGKFIKGKTPVALRTFKF